jgi:hypothetical protein
MAKRRDFKHWSKSFIRVISLVIAVGFLSQMPPAKAQDAPVCGNNITEPGEACDGMDLNGYTCSSVAAGLVSGPLSCKSDCSGYDVSQCSAGGDLTAASCSQEDVQAAIDAAKEGDTVHVPSGTCLWSQTVTLSDKNIILQGAGIDQTIISLASGSSEIESLLTVTGAEGKPFQITGLTFSDTSLRTTLLIRGNNKNFRIDHCKFTRLGSHSITVGGNTYGVIDHCEFIDSSQEDIAVSEHDGEASWDRPLSLGTAEAVFVEDCAFVHNGNHGHSITSNRGARTVFRHNTVMDTDPTVFTGPIDVHGNCSTGCRRGGRSYEIYENTVSGAAVGRAIILRGGDGVVFNNTLNGKQNGVAIFLRNYRSTTTLCAISETYCDPRWYPQCYGENDYPAPDQIREAYFWNNTWNGDPVLPTVDSQPYTPLYIQENRDYFNMAKPDYTPYPYPHPLVAIGTTIACLPGDLDCDQQINGADIRLWIDVFLGRELRSEVVIRADVNIDGMIDVLDLQEIINTVASQ